MDDDRFKNYINELEPETTCEAFLNQNQEILKKIKSNKKFKREFEVYNALGHELRYMIYKILQNKPMCVCALAQVFEKSDSTIAYHLNILQDAALIIGKKKGYFTIYYSKEGLLSEINQIL